MNIEGLKEALDELAARRAAAPLIEARMDKIAVERDQYLAYEIDNRKLKADRDRWRAVAEQQNEALKLAATLPCDWEAIGLPCRPGCVTCAARAAMGSFDAAVKGE